MADDEVFSGEGLDETPEQEAERSGGFIPAVILKILKYVALGLAAIIFIVTTVVITVKVLDKGPQAEAYPSASPEYTEKVPIYSWYDIPEIRGRTADENPHTVIVDAKLGYEKDSKKIQTELIARSEQIIDIIRHYFAGYKAGDLSPNNEDRIKVELKEKINAIMSSDDSVEEIVFLQFSVIEF